MRPLSMCVFLQTHSKPGGYPDQVIEKGWCWADLGWLLNAHQAALSLPLLNQTGRENKAEKLVG